MTPHFLSRIVIPLAVVGCSNDSSRATADVASSTVCRPSQQQATKIGEAVLHVRAARVYASSNQQRAALLELEDVLRRSIAAATDTAWQTAARRIAADSFMNILAESMRRGIDRAAGEAESASARSDIQTALLRGYGEHLESAALATSPESDFSCLKPSSDRAHQLAIDALRAK